MILIFCFQSNKHWHENEPQAETSNEKMKLVFQLTDQKHFIHYNQAFIWQDFFSSLFFILAFTFMCARSFMCVMSMCACVHVHVHASVCALLLLVIATPGCSLWHFQSICTRSSCLALNISNVMPLLSLLYLSQSITEKLQWLSNQLHLLLRCA